MLLAAFLVQPAAAQERPLMLRLGGTLAWDDNVFRVPESAPDPQAARGISGKADRVTTAYVGLRLDKTYSQQRFVLDATETATRYDKFSSLDRDTSAYRGEWNWHFTPRISGTLSAERTESPTPFDDTRDLEPNVVVVTKRDLTVAAGLFGGWQLLGGASESERKNTRVFLAEPDSSQSGVEAGLRYTAASRNAITFTRRSQQGSTSGDPAAGATGDFTIQESEATAVWVATGRSSLNGRLTRTERRHSDTPERDFSGTTGELLHVWTPGGRLTLTTSARRALAPFVQGTRSTYRADDIYALAPTWQLTEKLRLTARISRQDTDYLGPAGPVTEPARRDVLRSATLSAEWSAHRRLVLSASLRHERRSSTDAEFVFDNTVASVVASLTL